MRSEKCILGKILTHRLTYLDVDARILLKWISKKSVRTWIQPHFGTGPTDAFCDEIMESTV